MRSYLLALVVFVLVVVVGCTCGPVAPVVDASGGAVFRQDACARWLITHESRGCDLSTWACPVDVDGPPLTPSEVSECDADIAMAMPCTVPACEVSP
jgi:hypothetical protein